MPGSHFLRIRTTTNSCCSKQSDRKLLKSSETMKRKSWLILMIPCILNSCVRLSLLSQRNLSVGCDLELKLPLQHKVAQNSHKNSEVKWIVSNLINWKKGQRKYLIEMVECKITNSVANVKEWISCLYMPSSYKMSREKIPVFVLMPV